MQGLSGRDEQSILAFVTQDTQRWTPKYKERPTQYRRRNVIFGTTNDPDILPTYGAARRWLPIKIHEVIDVDAVIRDRDQLWAEGVRLFDHGGIAQADADTLARDERDAFREEDSAEAAVVKWLGEPATDEKGAFVAGRTRGDDPFSMGDLLSRLTANNVKHTQKRLSNLLRKLGYDNRQVGGRHDRGRKWVKTDYVE
jgi:predicted P-loop ATPase